MTRDLKRGCIAAVELPGLHASAPRSQPANESLDSEEHLAMGSGFHSTRSLPEPLFHGHRRPPLQQAFIRQISRSATGQDDPQNRNPQLLVYLNYGDAPDSYSSETLMVYTISQCDLEGGAACGDISLSHGPISGVSSAAQQIVPLSSFGDMDHRVAVKDIFATSGRVWCLMSHTATDSAGERAIIDSDSGKVSALYSIQSMQWGPESDQTWAHTLTWKASQLQKYVRTDFSRPEGQVVGEYYRDRIFAKDRFSSDIIQAALRLVHGALHLTFEG